jgi:hypothetical protein
MKSCFYFCSLILLVGCNTARNIHPGEDKQSSFRGVYKLLSLQAQDDVSFKAMNGVEIIKIFTASNWISAAYLGTNKKVVNVSGGTYRLADGKMFETILYHSKDIDSIGVTTAYKIEFLHDKFYQSGIFRAGTPKMWKVEEYWIKVGE